MKINFKEVKKTYKDSEYTKVVYELSCKKKGSFHYYEDPNSYWFDSNPCSVCSKHNDCIGFPDHLVVELYNQLRYRYQYYKINK